VSLRPLGLGSLGNKLALLFAGITALGFSVVFFYVVPGIESGLESQSLGNLRRVAVASSTTLAAAYDSDSEPTEPQLNQEVRAAADAADARVTLFGRRRGRGELYVISDSRVVREIDVPDETARVAARSGRVATGVTRDADGERVAQAARPLGRAGPVVLYSRSLEDVNDAVGLVQRQVLAATAFAVLVALVGGYLVARALARRVRRLERAAKQVAAGEFIDPLPIDSEDELGQLTRTFNEMERQLAQVDRARREFIANASHELRTPIFSLGGFVELLEDEEIDPETREEFLVAMREQVNRLQKLAVDLLDLSRIDAGALELELEPVDLAELAREVVGEFTPMVGQRRTELEVDLPAGGAEAYCDRERVAQIMRILLDNALRHTPEGTRVVVGAGRRAERTEFAVADTGPGLDGDASEVFERFYTGDAARGSGLGLAIAKELAERMEGAIRVDAARGRTRFTLALPHEGGRRAT
jgi:signal transduction histidine kinase